MLINIVSISPVNGLVETGLGMVETKAITPYQT